MTKPKVCIAGTGYVGLVAGSCFADKGFDVVCSTLDERKVDLINQGKAPFYEKDLDPIVERAVGSGKMKAMKGRLEAIQMSDIIFISVGTPSLPDGSCDLRFIRGVAEEIGKAIKDDDRYRVAVVRSTVVPRTTRDVVIPLIEEYSGKKAGEGFGICMSPEFLRQGNSVFDTYNPDRLVVGEFDKRSGDVLYDFYRQAYSEDLPVLRMSMESAELVKYAANSLLATKISFANEIANIAETIPGVDVKEVMDGAGLDNRLNRKFLDAGCGFGGSCFPKDVKALISFAKGNGYKPLVLDSVIETNLAQARHMVELAERELGSLEGKNITILGLAFKPDTDDMREAPAIKIINQLLEKNANVRAYDPVAMENSKTYWLKDKPVDYKDSIDAAIEGSDVVLVLTDWPHFKEITADRYKQLMPKPVVIDARRAHDPKTMDGVRYVGIGLKS